MKRLQEMIRRLSYLGRRRGFDRELDDEVRFHIESRADELESSGLSRRDAMAQARRELGSSVRWKEEVRASWQFWWIEDLVGDLRYAARALRRSPGFTLAAVASLALGIGANTTIFSLTMEFLFSAPSVREADTLARLQISGSTSSSMTAYRFIRDARIFDGLAGINEMAEVNWRLSDQTYRLWASAVTTNYFDVTGTPVLMGRPIQATDEGVVVVSHGMWQRRMGGDPEVLGRLLVLDGQSYTVIGVLPRDHRTITGFGFSPDLYLSISPTDDKRNVAFIARLPNGVSRQAALPRLTALCKQMDAALPEEQRHWAHYVLVDAITGMDRLRNLAFIPFAAFFGMVMGVVGLVFLIACANVASLLLARASSRRQELAIRLAIGASRGRVLRQLLTESLLLAGVGAGCGLLLNIWMTTLLNQVRLPQPVPIQLLIRPDWRLLAYSTVLVLVSALVSGLLPAFKATQHGVNLMLKSDERQVSGSGWNLRNALVVGQLALSMMLLGAGLLFLNNLSRASSMNPGFDVDHTVWAYVRLVPERYLDAVKTLAFIATALDQLRGLPGVQGATNAMGVPLNDARFSGTEASTDVDSHRVGVNYNDNHVGSDYFQTMGIPLLAGREFGLADGKGSPPVVILNENFARHLFGKLNPVGHRIQFGNDKPVEVVGVARNSKYFTLGEENTLALYAPYPQMGGSVVNLNFLVRVNGSPESVVKGLNAALGDIDPTAAIEVRPMRNSLGMALLASRVGAGLLGSMGVLGLALAAIGLYGVLAYAVGTRIREIGLRMALGAQAGDILRMVARQSLYLWGAGVAIGGAASVFAMRPLAMFLVPGLSPSDPATFGGAIGVLAIVAAVATIGPAVRAVRVDPVRALRWE